MKKLICTLMAVALLFTCVAGCGNESTDNASSVVSPSDSAIGSEFVKPDNYTTVVLVTINPQFRLYLDSNGIVLAVESVNDDAKSIESKISFENQKVEAVISNLIVAANDSSFIKTDASIDIKVTEVVDKSVDTTDILNKITASTNSKLEELSVKAEVTATVELESDEPTESDEAITSSESTGSSEVADTTSESEDTTPEKPACQHSKTKAVATNTGDNIIDASKSDVVNHTKQCADCGEKLGLEKHTVKDGKCTLCGQANFETSSILTSSASVADDNDFCAAKINDDGSLNYDLVIERCWWDAKGTWTDEWSVTIPEAEMLKAIRAEFVMSDAEFEKLKQQGMYNCSLGTQTYSNGYFYCKDPCAGGPGNYSHEVVGYKDNKSGTFTVYYDYLLGGPDVEEAEREHKYYYAVEYSYSGASNLAVVAEDYSYSINGWKPVIESLRIKAVKKVADVSGITVIK